jgi:GNAT superfamily N-acetyltransferase
VIEGRTFEESAAELALFSQRAWHDSYRGRMPIPLWDGQYFEWQFPREAKGGRDYVVAAYEGSKLVGVLGAQPFRFRWDGEEADGTMGSWFSVSPDHQRQGIGSRLFAEQRRRHLERGERFMLGYAFTGAGASMGPRFFARLPHVATISKIGCWVRVLDHRAVARWAPSIMEGLAARALGVVQRAPRGSGHQGMRRYRATDLPACLALLGELLDGVSLGFVWNRERLAHQLEHDGVAETVVAEDGGRVAGFLNYHRLEYRGRGTVLGAVVHLLAPGRLDRSRCRSLLGAALSQMAEEHVQVAVVLGLACYPKGALWGAGFVPMPRDMTLICICMDPTFPARRMERFFLYLR